MNSFDPDVEEPDVLDEVPERQLRDAVGIDVAEALAVLDRVSARIPGGGEIREGQRQMLTGVVTAFTTREPTFIEAGTGVGKSLAYLIPAALARRRVVVATATKNLQDQLALNDAPLLQRVLPATSVAVLKGKQNYLCRLKVVENAGADQLSFDDGSAVPVSLARQVRRLVRFAQETETGERDDVEFDVDPRAWRSVSVSAQECVGRATCPQGHNCFHELAKDRAQAADVVIVNTHLYASHLASGSMLLPEHDLVVFDEAHEVPDIFSALLGTSLSPSRLVALAQSASPLIDDEVLCDSVRRSGESLARVLEEQFATDQTSGLSPATREELDVARAVLGALVEALRTTPVDSSGAEARRARALGPAQHALTDLTRLLEATSGELVYLTRSDRDLVLELNVLDLGPRLREDLWSAVTPVLTSATLPDSLAPRLGLTGATSLQVPSPFDYRSHALLYVPEDFPARNDERAEGAIVEELITLINAAGGRTLALFTNRTVMARVAEAVERRVSTPILVQGTLSRQRLIEEFRETAEASLFAVTSFWQGVDVPGHSLSLVTIDRLPFAVPNDPLAVARRERSSNPFVEVDLPRATMLLAQGVGRLIRSAQDRGVVAVLDTRLAEATYRSQLFRKLPPMRRTRTRSQVVEFLEAIRDEHEAV
ncbi:MAG: ATP-dependent DNA helicase [Acidobacteria bacterium]|nr:ATP-dependent DNA helicase [Acidobacteriota bacterium]